MTAVLSQLVGAPPGAPGADRPELNCNNGLDADDALRILDYKAGAPLAQPSGCSGVGTHT